MTTPWAALDALIAEMRETYEFDASVGHHVPLSQVEQWADRLAALRAHQEQEPTQAEKSIADDSLGLSIDMLDVDRLREWARLLLVHGADIGHWGSVIHVAGTMQLMATGIEKAVRDIGVLRVKASAGGSPEPDPPQEPHR